MRAGLCDSCRYARLIRSPRGPEYLLCERSRSDPQFPRYPRLPVLRCSGYSAGRFEAGSPRRGRADR